MTIRQGTGGVELREYRPSDILALFRLDQVCFEPRFQFSLHAMRDFAEAPGAVSVVAEAGGEVAGFAIGEVEGNVCYLVTIDVDPGWRQGGFARSMMGWIAEKAWAMGARRMELHVFVENAAAIRFYERLGFGLVGAVPDFYGDGVDALYYARGIDFGGLVRPI
ncbi:ribosomal-protein-alanine N-acetyltransferase [Granulicella pectinivorans]|uniref:Ribosomal-protein-alanine N-acetyltransferase n=1 Tax=Granulicella pectinivorans TaxID=474950 RepID=A0A1I6M3N3_9BACT|nr:GNAT family N-acetyltransferase [Granulicella pectinivorans]SFS10279.1 ribosomal-protein-alanine N-acetyltransferase [Granulicella pectinivorans]